MNYYLLGTGRMASFLAGRLSAGGHTCAGIWGRDADKARALAARHHLPVVPRLANIADGPDACFFAISDGAVEAVAGLLSLSQTVAVHLSGTLPVDALLPAKRRAVCWPVYSITEKAGPIHRPVPCVWDANTPEGEGIAAAVAAALNGTLQRGDDATRTALHLAAVFANNFSTHMLALCEAVCREQGVPFSLLHPIIRQTFERALEDSPAAVQTGPARRGDAATMASHLARLSSHPQWAAVYRAVSESIAALRR